MDRAAPVEHAIHPLLVERHSPYAFDPNRDVAPADITALFEAARWAMSSYNAQPWRYIVGVKATDPALWTRLHSVLVVGNQPWAANAPVLALGIAQHHFEHNGKPNKAALHDLGAASAFLTVEATARGLCVHQMIGIDVDAARQVFDLQHPLEPYTALAIGHKGLPEHVKTELAERDTRARERKPLSEILLAGR